MKDHFTKLRLMREAIRLLERSEALLLKARAAHEKATGCEQKKAA